MIKYTIKKMLRMIKYTIKKPLQWIKNRILDVRANYYLDKTKQLSDSSTLNVGFMVFEPETWDKLQPLYERMMDDNRFNPILIVIPSFDTHLALSQSYGYEKDFFLNKYPEAILAYDNRELLDLKKLNLQYLFYQDHYNIHYPKEYRSNVTVKYTRICYIPYGYSVLENFTSFLASHVDFFRHVSIFFAQCSSDKNAVEKLLSKNIKKNRQQVVYLGYPALEKYMKWDRKKIVETITWSPRWSYDDKLGGSHFFEYKDMFTEMASNRRESFLIRPHPMMFENFKQMNIMTENAIDEYKLKLDSLGVVIDDRSPIDEILNKTDLLVTDVSSIIASFFVTGRPIIYCECKMKPNEDLMEMMKGMYIASNEIEVRHYIDQIVNGNDYLASTRQSIIEGALFSVHKNATSKIMEYLNTMSK